MEEKKFRKSLSSERISIDKKKLSNEIKLIRRNLENNTYEVYEEQKIKRITSWRKSQSKFCKNLIYNILTFGILHIISLFYPRLYVKLYCNPWQAKESDYFLVEDINGDATLCPIQRKKDKSIKNYSNNKKNLIDDNSINIKYNNNFSKYFFEYKSITFEYKEKNNEIIAVYMDLSKMKNDDIIDCFCEGLSNEKTVEALTEKYGKNEYKLNIKLYLISLLKNQIPIYVFILLIEIIEFICLNDPRKFIFKISLLFVIVAVQITNIKVNIINKYKNEFSLDGNEKKINVKRKYLIKENNKIYCTIDNIDLLPGDIIYLKQKDLVPCDCLIIEGECIVSQSDLTGNLNISKKMQIKNNNKQFNYKYANINILYHGMEIKKTFSKNNQEFITALCINIGPNTMKANQYSNILDFIKKNMFNLKNNIFYQRKRIIIFMIISLLFPIIIIYLGLNNRMEKTDYKKDLKKLIVSLICKSTMTNYYLVEEIIVFLNVILLQKSNITCFDQSKIINIGKTNQIIFNKTETLNKNNLSIYSHHPIYFNSKNKGQLKFLNYTQEQIKELNRHLFDYYQNYIKNNYLNDSSLNNSKNVNKKKELNFENYFKNKSDEIITFIRIFIICHFQNIFIKKFNF